MSLWTVTAALIYNHLISSVLSGPFKQAAHIWNTVAEYVMIIIYWVMCIYIHYAELANILNLMLNQ